MKVKHEADKMSKQNCGYLGHFAKKKYLKAGHNTVEETVDKIKQGASDALLSVYERIDNKVISPEARAKAREADPEFRRNDDSFQKAVQERNLRKAKESQ